MSIFFWVFLLYGLSLVYPFINAVLTSLKDGPSLEYAQNPFALPKSFLIKNYLTTLDIFKLGSVGIVGMFFNTINLTVGGTVAGLVSSTLAAYIVAKYKFRFSGVIYSVAVFIMVVPVVGSLPATYKLLTDLHLINNPYGIWLTYASGFGFNFLLLYGYFKSVSWSYAEAAFVDGASDFGVFVKIMLPQSVPVFVSVGIVTGIGIWNDYYTPFLYMEKFPTLSYGLFELQAQVNSSAGSYPYFLAATVLSTLPVIVVFAAFQKVIMENTVAGGLKG